MVAESVIEEVVRRARRSVCYLPYVSSEGVLRGTIPIKMRRFKRVGLLIDLDFPFILTNAKIEKIQRYLEYVLEDITATGFKEQLRVSKGFIKCAVYEGDEKFVLGSILDLIEEAEITKERIGQIA